MIIPPPISIGDTIAVVAPASPFDPAKMSRGIALIRDMGFEVVFPDDLLVPRGYLANTDAARAGHINRYFKDDHVRAIVCARGGYGAGRLMALIDYDLVRLHPKIFVGFSDITFLLNAMLKEARVATFHGPMAATLSMSDSASRASFFNRLLHPLEPLCLAGCEVIRPGRGEGPIIGGNLTVFCHLMGTSFQPDVPRCLLFLEDQGEARYRIDRMMTHLKLAGFLDRVSGVILGTFSNCGLYRGVTSLMADFCGELNIPLVAGFSAGHTEANLTVPMGIPAVLDTETQQVDFTLDL